MRDFKGMKRQRGRNRNGGGRPQHNANRAFESNGPDGIKVRGAAQHVYERYQQLARDAATAGDRITAENYLQHAEHYFRVMRAMQPQRPIGEIVNRDQYVSGYDIDFEDESGAQAEAAEAAEAEAERQGERGDRFEPRPYEGRRDDGRRDDGRPSEGRDFRPQDGRPRDDNRRSEFGDGRPRDDNRRGEFGDGRPRGDFGEGRNRNFRYDRPRYDRDDRRPRFDRQEGQRPPAPEREPEAPQGHDPSSPVLRADDGEVSHAPAFLKAPAPEAREEGEARRPRRRREPAPSEAAEGSEE